MNRQAIYSYYTRDDIASEIFSHAARREIAGAYWDGRYDKRPNVLQFKQDISRLVHKGITSFHYSVEHWSNPMALAPDTYDKLRVGWDMIFDIDSKLGMEGAQIAAELILSVLKKYGITNAGVKFSGSRGFHICLPWIMFPKEIDYEPLAQKYPDVPRALAEFVRHEIKDALAARIHPLESTKKLLESLGPQDSFDPFFFIDVEKSWGNRHMFRAPYSFNEKTWLVSLPLDKSALARFTRDDARPEVVVPKHAFFAGEENEASDLLLESIDFMVAHKKDPAQKKVVTKPFTQKIPESQFPPCITNILSGLTDGKKRSVYTLTSFLQHMNWNWEEIEAILFSWNEKNKPPLPRSVLLSQLLWAKRNDRLPGNCFHDHFYMSIGVCKPDDLCTRMNKKSPSNPVSYPILKMPRQEKRWRGFSCGSCNEEFKTMRSLKTHQTRTH